MPARLLALCLDALDPLALGRFWAEGLGWELDEGAGAGGVGEVRLVPPVDTGLPIVLRRTGRAKAAKNPIHLDLSSSSLDDQAAAVDRLCALGATDVDVGQRPEDTHVVLADPEGNELCVLEPANTFVDRAVRFGSITCDGSPAVGHFWSAVLGWPLVWDQEGETAIRSPAGTGPFLTWGPPVPADAAASRHHLVLAGADVDELVALGAREVGAGALVDPDGYELLLDAGTA